MNGPSMAPRSYAYSGGERIPYMRSQQSDVERAYGAVSSDPRQVPAYGISAASEPTSRGGGFLKTINDIAGALLPILDVARSFKAGYQGLPLPGRSSDDSRMAGDRFMFEIYQNMLQRNEQEAQRAREERKSAGEEDFRRQLILKGVEKGDISLDKALKALQGEKIEFGTPSGSTNLPSEAPVQGAS
jgi:hypothetical protein